MSITSVIFISTLDLRKKKLIITCFSSVYRNLFQSALKCEKVIYEVAGIKTHPCVADLVD